jgi:dihydrodipicolinate synthase/N-acetylneuraminate lyase
MVPIMKNAPPTPAKRALAALDQPPEADTRVRQRRISKRINAAIDLLASGGVKTIKEAAEKAGMARESLSRALSTPHIAEHLRTKVLKALAMAAARAGAVKTDLLDSDNAIARDRASS